MTTLYRSLQKAARHPLPQNSGISCPNQPTNEVVWDYNITVHYAHHANRSFTETDACQILTDDQTHARELGGLPELSPARTGVVQWLSGR